MHGLQWDCSLTPATTRDAASFTYKEYFLKKTAYFQIEGCDLMFLNYDKKMSVENDVKI
jgi:hypothetical protein